jgi:hypothetical protein
MGSFYMTIEVAGEMVRVETHMCPHLDELAAIAAVQECATTEFLGKHCQNGELRLGTGGGPFDEHPNEGNPDRREDDCCMTLVAKELGIFHKRAWRFLVAHCHFSETRELLNRSSMPPERHHIFDLYHMVNLRWQALLEQARRAGREPTQEEMEAVARTGIDYALATVCDQELFQQAVKALEDDQRCQVEKIRGPRETDLQLVTVELNDGDGQAGSKIVPAAIALHQADVILWRNAPGDVHVATNTSKRSGIRTAKTEGGSPCDLDDLVCCLKVEEQRRQDAEKPFTDWRAMRQEGIAFDGDRWYYDRFHGAAHNGTRSYPDTPPTAIPFEDIRKILLMAMMDYGFEATRAKRCRTDWCEGESCPRHRYGLRCCCAARARQRQRRGK